MMTKSTTQKATAIALVGLSFFAFEAAGATAQEQRGRTLAAGLCGGCHATGKAGISQHIGAPPFRVLDRQLDLDKFGQRLREGLLGSHRDMPMFRFSRDDARALVAYLRSIQGP